MRYRLRLGRMQLWLTPKRESKGVPITWVACDENVLKNIKQETGDKDYYMMVSLNE